MIKICPRHGESEFSGTARLRCKKCNVEAVSKKRRKLKQDALFHMGGRCKTCGYDRCSDALEFHHLDPEVKDFSISDTGRTRSLSSILKELEKCVLLCSNCHREAHALFDRTNGKHRIVK